MLYHPITLVSFKWCCVNRNNRMLQSWSLSVTSSIYRYLLSVCYIVLESTVGWFVCGFRRNCRFCHQPLNNLHGFGEFPKPMSAPAALLGKASTHFPASRSGWYMLEFGWQSQWSKESSIVCMVAALSSRAAEGCSESTLLLTILSVGDRRWKICAQGSCSSISMELVPPCDLGIGLAVLVSPRDPVEARTL